MLFGLSNHTVQYTDLRSMFPIFNFIFIAVDIQVDLARLMRAISKSTVDR